MSALQIFLKKYIIESNENAHKNATHIAIDKDEFYNIPDDKYCQFINLYKHDQSINLLEKSNETNYLCIKIEFSSNDGKRLYTDAQVHDIIKFTNEQLEHYYKLNPFEYSAYVGKYENPISFSRAKYYDEIYISYPSFAMSLEMRYIIVQKVSKYIQSLFPLNGNAYESIKIIVNDAIIFDRGNLMYGSKINNQNYKITQIYSKQLENLLNESDIEKEGQKENHRLSMIDALSYRRFSNDDQKELLTKPTEKLDTQYSSLMKTNEKNINRIKKLLNILKTDRAIEFKPWSAICWALYNVDSTRLFDEFINFSRQAGSKYDYAGCVKYWRISKTYGYNLTHLRSWAKEDSPKEYAKLEFN